MTGVLALCGLATAGHAGGTRMSWFAGDTGTGVAAYEINGRNGPIARIDMSGHLHVATGYTARSAATAVLENLSTIPGLCSQFTTETERSENHPVSAIEIAGKNFKILLDDKGSQPDYKGVKPTNDETIFFSTLANGLKCPSL